MPSLGRQQTYSNPGTVTDCAVRYRSTAVSTEVAPAIPTTDACTPIDRGQGTIAPAPPRASTP